jgi:hypothetical protein
MGNDLLFRCHQTRLSKAMNSISKEQSIRGAFFGAIVADALCLGSHYEYDAIKIHEAYGSRPIEKFMSPGELMGGQTHGIDWVLHAFCIMRNHYLLALETPEPNLSTKINF